MEDVGWLGTIVDHDINTIFSKCPYEPIFRKYAFFAPIYSLIRRSRSACVDRCLALAAYSTFHYWEHLVWSNAISKEAGTARTERVVWFDDHAVACWVGMANQ